MKYSKSYRLTKEEYNYLLPVLKEKLLVSSNKHKFIGNSEELEDMINRLKGLYNYYEELHSKVLYKCFCYGSLKPFRDKFNLK